MLLLVHFTEVLVSEIKEGVEQRGSKHSEDMKVLWNLFLKGPEEFNVLVSQGP